MRRRLLLLGFLVLLPLFTMPLFQGVTRAWTPSPASSVGALFAHTLGAPTATPSPTPLPGQQQGDGAFWDRVGKTATPTPGGGGGSCSCNDFDVNGVYPGASSYEVGDEVQFTVEIAKYNDANCSPKYVTFDIYWTSNLTYSSYTAAFSCSTQGGHLHCGRNDYDWGGSYIYVFFTANAPGTATVDVRNFMVNNSYIDSTDGTSCPYITGSGSTTINQQPTPTPTFTPTSTPTPMPASLGDFVWWDQDNDGVQDAGEPGLEGVEVTLKNANGDTVATTTTDSNGYYHFGGLQPGDYTVVFTLPGSDWTFSPADQGDDATDSDANETTGEAATTLSAGEDDDTLDAGMYIPSSYVITKENTTVETELAPGDPISFTITIQNTGKTWLTSLPLKDEYDVNYLTYVNANPASDDNNDDGVINWSDLTVSFGRDLGPGESFDVIVNFTAKTPTDDLPNHETINTATAYNVRADPDGANGPIGDTTLPDRTDDAPVSILDPVDEAMRGFWARVAGHAVRLRWQTASERDILGFNVLRSVEGGPFVQINASIIFARHAGANASGLYSFHDRGLPGERVTYILEIIHLDGSVERYGQVMIEMPETK